VRGGREDVLMMRDGGIGDEMRGDLRVIGNHIDTLLLMVVNKLRKYNRIEEKGGWEEVGSKWGGSGVGVVSLKR